MPAITLVGGPRHGQIIEVADGVSSIHVPQVDGGWIQSHCYDALTGAWISSGTAEFVPSMLPPINPEWTEFRSSRVTRLRRFIGLRIAGVAEFEIRLDDREPW